MSWNHSNMTNYVATACLLNKWCIWIKPLLIFLLYVETLWMFIYMLCHVSHNKVLTFWSVNMFFVYDPLLVIPRAQTLTIQEFLGYHLTRWYKMILLFLCDKAPLLQIEIGWSVQHNVTVTTKFNDIFCCFWK